MTMVTFILSALLAFVGVAMILYVDVYKVKRKEKTKISFKEGLDLTEVPIVTFNCGNEKLHFLLDTGSNVSFLNKEVLKKIPHKKANIVSQTVGMEGKEVHTEHYRVTIGYKDQTFEEIFGVLDLSEAFKAVTGNSGIKVHGILGSKFFEKYKYILDFNELIAYR